jgi:hypothetical protein
LWSLVEAVLLVVLEVAMRVAVVLVAYFLG